MASLDVDTEGLAPPKEVPLAPVGCGKFTVSELLVRPPLSVRLTVIFWLVSEPYNTQRKNEIVPAKGVPFNVELGKEEAPVVPEGRNVKE